MSLAAQDERLTRRVGAISLCVIALAIGFFVFVYGRIDWGSHVRVHVYFHHTGGMREGASFVVAGRAVGRVESIALVPHGTPIKGACDSQPIPDDGEDRVMATVAIDTDLVADLDRCGDMFVASRGALSEKYLELGPPAEPTAHLAAGDNLLGRDPPSLDRVLQRTWDNLMVAASFAAQIRPEFQALRAQVDELRSHFDTTGGNLSGLVPSIERMGPLIDDASQVNAQIKQLRGVALGGDAGRAQMQKLLDDARAALAETRGKLDALGKSADTLRAAIGNAKTKLATKGAEAIDKVELAIDRTREAIDKIDPLLAQIDALNASLARGEGSMMKLMHDPEFPEDAKELGKILKRQPWKVMDRPTK